MSKKTKLRLAAGTNDCSVTALGFETFTVIKIHSELTLLFNGEKITEGNTYVVTFPFNIIIPVKYLRKEFFVEIMLA